MLLSARGQLEPCGAEHVVTGPRWHYGSCVLVLIFQPFADVFSSERQHCAELGEEQKEISLPESLLTQPPAFLLTLH